jgi:cellulose synthase/poly-beta-1,6-N-acetylglucosamine synthase-like glycosyltransferase
MNTAPEWLRDVLGTANQSLLWYFLAVNTIQLALCLLAARTIVRHRRRVPFAGGDDAYRNSLTPPVTVLMPAYNEGMCVVQAIHAVLALHYPRFEVIVIDDGSTDDTFEQLRLAFDLVEVPRVYQPTIPTRGALRSIHLPATPVGSEPDTLLVVRKDNGGKADALNTGINLATHPMVCMVDADSMLDPDALLQVVKPFLDDPLTVVATGGIVRVANGGTTIAGRLIDVRMPRKWLPRIQVVEYLRAFILSRIGWSSLGGLLIISGAFGMFERDLLKEIGGLNPDCIGEDAELVVRLHRAMRDRRADYRVTFVAEPVCWSEVPATFRVLAAQRRRWHRGLFEIISRHLAMVGRSRYGRIGLVVMPYFILFELLAPVVELSALILLPVGILVGAVDLTFAWQLATAAYGYAIVVTLAATTTEELCFPRYHRWSDIGAMVVAAVIENIGYRQLVAAWQVVGIVDAIRKRQSGWGTMTRTGFGKPAARSRPRHRAPLP